MLLPMSLLGIGLTAAGLALAGGIAPAWEGLKAIALSQDVLITDYMALVGPGPALVNAGIITLVTLALLVFCGEPLNGFTLVTVGLMAGFSLFGKNLFNIWPILLGGWLYAKADREPFAKYLHITLLTTALSPLVSFMAFAGEKPMLWPGLLAGVAAGFFVPPVAAYTFRVQNGMNLYNAGFACGLFAMMTVPALKAFGLDPASAMVWGTGYDLPIALAVTLACCGLIAWALCHGGRGCLGEYRKLLRTSGRAPSDYLRAFGGDPVLLNMGLNGLIAMGVILLTGGDLNGPTLGGILTIMGFSAYGKHPRNIVPVMAGVLLGSLFNHAPLNSPALQLAGLFGTTLAPLAGCFGWPAGVLAGFIHSSVVLHAGMPLEGMNLYNNGFSGGLVAIVLYPVLTALVRRRRAVVLNEDYFDVFEKDAPISEESLDARGGDGTRKA